jgi:NAD(P)-dependent dehydrogenase (short-subunit alcohol dehydrogenase family)
MTLDDGFRALVIGSSGALGQAFLKHFEGDVRCVHALGLSRSTHPDFDLNKAASIAQAAREMAPLGPFHIIVDATGALTIGGVGPEKSLKALDAEQFIRALHINTVGPAMLLQHFAPLMAPGLAVYAKLSARVGSISDNRSGGWYSYRASKAAMNMVLQTAAIELQRRNPQWQFVALQPGTVRSALSAPFAAGVKQLLEPEASVAAMVHAMMQLPIQAGAQFIDYRGQTIPW